MRTSLLSLAFVAPLALTGCAAKGLRADLDATRAELTKCQGDLTSCKTTLDGQVSANQLAEKRLAAYRDLAKKLREALGADGVDIIMRNGRLVVQLPNAILFESGKTAVSAEGRKMLIRLAKVMEDADRNFLVAGHTDDVPVKADAARFTNNWELSVLRATSAVAILTEAGVPAARVGAAGYGDAMPDKPNTTDKGKAENRRLEIIVMPNLDEIPPMPETL